MNARLASFSNGTPWGGWPTAATGCYHTHMHTLHTYTAHAYILYMHTYIHTYIAHLIYAVVLGERKKEHCSTAALNVLVEVSADGVVGHVTPP